MIHAARVARRAQVAELGLGRRRETVLLATALVAGLVLLAPAVAWLVGRLALPVPYPLLVGVAVAGALYGLLALSIGRILRGAAVALIVTATFAAGVPLTPAAGVYQMSLGPELWLVHLPLLALVGLLAARGAFGRVPIARAEYAYGAFVLWSLAVAVLADVPRVDTALYYALFAFYGLVAFAATYRSVGLGVLDLPSVLLAFLVTVGGHVAFAVAQIANQGSFGLSTLGETVRGESHTLVGVGPLGEFHVGIFVSGLTGGNGALAVLLVFALPLGLAVAARRRGWRRVAVLLVVVVVAAVLRFTGKDAARGGALIALALFGSYVLWRNHGRLAEVLSAPSRLADVATGLRRHAGTSALAALAVGVLFYPTTITDPFDAGGAAGSADTPGGGPSSGRDLLGGVDPSSVRLPFFNTYTLGIRLDQYLIGLDVFLEHPLLGVGGANFPYVAATYGVASYDGSPMHNLYLALLVGTGLPGFLLYTLAVGLVLWSGWRLMRSPGADRTLVAGLLAGIVGFLAVSTLIIANRFPYAIPFWILAGALVGEHRRTLSEAVAGR